MPMRALGVCLLVPMLATGLLAQEPDSVPLYFAVGIPAGAGMVSDGNPTDWNWVPDRYVITSDEMTVLNGAIDGPDDFFAEIIHAWEPGSNLFRTLIHQHDDAFIHDVNPGCPFLDDGVEAHFDPNNGGGGPHLQAAEIDQREAFQLCFQNTVENLPITFYGRSQPTENWYVSTGDFFRLAMDERGTELYYEFDATLYDPINPKGGPDTSTLHVLERNSTIGVTIAVSDADPGINIGGNVGGEEGQNYWQAGFSTSEQFTNDGGIADVFLTPVDDTMTAVEATSWGQLKTLVGEEL